MTSPNVLLLVLDSVRAANTSLHGYETDTTPFLREFGDRATVYTQARAPGIHSVASHASLFTGYHVAEHRASDHEAAIDPDSTVWAALDSTHGYETGLFTPNVVVTESSNLAAPFATVEGPRRKRDPFPGALTPRDLPGETEPVEYVRRCLVDGRPVRAFANGIADRLSHRRSRSPETEHAGVYVDAFLDWQAERSGPWAACLNLMDAHYPYLPREGYDHWGGSELRDLYASLPSGPQPREFLTGRPWWQLRAFEALYDGCIRQTDAAVERLVAELSSRDELDSTLLVVTADHGEGFGERSRLRPDVRLIDHNWGIHEALTHVPLVVSHPGRSDGKRIDEPASLTRFPAVVRSALDDSGDPEGFVPEGPVIASSYRVREPGAELPVPPEERERYFGPWHAVYERTGEGVRKEAKRRSDSAAVRIHDARTAYRTGSGDPARIDRLVGAMEDPGIARGDDRDVDASVERRLEDLGYMR